jgi:hypothetical protein
MILELNHHQAEVLQHLFEKVVNPALPADVNESLQKDLLRNVYRKLCTRLEARRQYGYNLTLSDLEGKAFYLYFTDRLLGPGWLYEQHLVDNLLVQLDIAYA